MNTQRTLSIVAALGLSCWPMANLALADGPGMAITEWMYAGSTTTGGEFVEFTNLGDQPIDMTGWSFDDDGRTPGAFDLSGFGIVMPGESVILTEDPAEDFRLTWGLGPEIKIVGELGVVTGNNLGRNDEINLYNADNELIDRLTYGDQAFPGSIRTRWFSGGPASTEAISANDPYQWALASVGDNAGSWQSAAGDIGSPGIYIPPISGEPLPGPVILSHASGFYTAAFELTIEGNQGNIIRYTLDGSIPTVDSTVYDGPITIASRAGEPNYFSTIPTAVGSNWALPLGEIFKLTPVRVRAFNADGEAGPIESRNFFIHPQGANRYSMPVIMITFDEDALFGYENGIYVPGKIYDDNFDPDLSLCSRPANYNQTGDAWERPAHLEFFEPDGTPGFSLDVGLRLHGGCTRVFRRKSLRVYARGEYGQPWIDYPVYPGDPVTSFKRLILRNSGNDWGRTMFRDAFLQQVIKPTGLGIQETRAAIVFLNGEYWGIHNIRERQDKYYLQTRYGVDPDNVDILENEWEVTEGDATHFIETYGFITSNDMSNDANLAWVEQRFDLDNLAAYFAAQVYINNSDWPRNNIRYWRERVRGSRWQWLVYDLDLSFGFNANTQPDGNRLSVILNATSTNRNAFMVRRLLNNTGFRHRFINITADQMNTVFVPDRVISVRQQFINEFQPEIPEHSVRWATSSISGWLNWTNSLADFATARPAFHRGFIVEGFELQGTADLLIQPWPSDAGTIMVNTIPLDAGDAPWSGVYFQGVPVPLRGIPADGYQFLGFAELDQTPDANGIVLWTPNQETTTLTPIFSSCPGDLDGNGVVDADDLGILLSSFGQIGSGLIADIDGNGVVNADDLGILLSAFGQSCTP